MRNNRVIFCIAAISVIACVLSYAIIAIAYDGCTVCWYHTHRENSIPEENWNCEYICANGLGECIHYDHPDCPGCYIRVCYFANGSQDYWYYRCKIGLDASCDDCGGDTTCGKSTSFACGTTTLQVYSDMLTPSISNFNLACVCVPEEPIEECVSCAEPWPQELLDKIANDMYKWENYGIGGGGAVTLNARRFYCNCSTGECEGRPIQGGTL